MAVEKPLLENLSLNQITTEYWNVKEAAEGCVKAEIPWISLWRHKIEEIGLAETKRIITGSGLKLSSLCRGGMFPAETAELRQKALDDNFRDRKSTRLNSSHVAISYAVFCLKKKKTTQTQNTTKNKT